MNVENERSTSLWMDTKIATAAPLRGTIGSDVVVIGSGIAGLSVAFELASRQMNVVVLDRGHIGKGMTSRTTAHLAPVCDDGAAELIKMRGEENAKLFWQSQAAGVARIESIIQTERIECNFRRLDAFLFPGPNTKQSDLDDELNAVKRTGMPAEKVHGIPLRGYEDVGCLRYPDQATFHPLRYLRGLAAAITKRQGRLYERTVVEAVEESGNSVVVRAANGGRVEAAAAVVATNSPINDRFALHTKLAPYRTYAMAFSLAKGTLPDALFWDTMDPYHYVRLQTGPGNGDYLIVGGEDHKSGEANDAWVRFEALEAWIRNLVPALGAEVTRWSGQVLDTPDYGAFSGRNPGNENVFVHTGDSGQGMTHGAMAGLLIADLITKNESPWQALYDPSRKPTRDLTNFARENMTAIKNFAEYLAPGEIGSYDELKSGEGAIVRDGLRKVAAYRDTKGKLHKCSAMCTHIGCHVHWNSFERCWDCPCHGS
ncbi:MAG: FAD-dependent oxidoreductase, partial [Pseudolabrys sp.]|nr:FAD-dependent oxidoreductase [Pseudolabrys sp.]